jgi:CRP-like cAMP-binding protein
VSGQVLTVAAASRSIIDVHEEDRLTLTHDRRAELIGACRLFSGVAPKDLAAVAQRAVEVEFPADRVIARQGEIGTGFFIVVDGSVRVIRGGENVAVLGPGEFFGELSVLDGLPRIAQVVAVEPTRCLALASWDFEQALAESPTLALAILRGLAARLRSVTEHEHH